MDQSLGRSGRGAERAVDPAPDDGRSASTALVSSAPTAALSSPDRLTDSLSLIAETIVSGLGYEVAVVNLAQPDGSFEVVAVAGPRSAHDLLYGTSASAASWDLLLDASQTWGDLRFLDHRSVAPDTQGMVMWVPDLPPSDDSSRWHPQDALFGPLRDAEGTLLGILSVDVPRDGRRPDPTARALLEAFTVAAALAIEQSALYQRVKDSEQLLRAVFHTSPVAIAVAGPDQKLKSVNPAYCRLLGRAPEDLLGRSPLRFTLTEDRQAASDLLLRVMQTGEQASLEKRYLHRDGHSVTARLQLARLGAGEECDVLAVAEDITASKRQESDLRFHATHDSLTGLPNRSLLMSGLAAALDRSAASRELVAVMFCDLDRVKLVNDTHGHAAGDQYIRAVGDRLRTALRGDDFVARLGGDEFVVVAEHLTTPTDVLGLAGRLMDAVRRPLQLEALDFAPAMSMGVAFEIGGTTRAEKIVADADHAMYEAKTHGRGTWRVFDPALRGAPTAHLDLRHQLGSAIRLGQFALHYQPIVRLADGSRVGYEALLRWQHPTHGLLSPGSFLDLIVDSEYEAPVTDWVIRQAAHDAATWPGGSRPWISVNVSALQLARAELPAVVSAALAQNGLDPRRMTIELTEDRFLEAAQGADRLQALRDTGVGISLDDFGTGYAGLGYVQRLPVDTLKIDRSFVSPLPEDEASRDIIEAICYLAGARGLHVVAEGIETPEQLQTLIRSGVGFGQGYLLGRPAPLGAYAAAATQKAASDR